MIEVRIFLYGYPSWDLNLKELNQIDPISLKIQGINLKNHLFKVAETVSKLQSKGWKLSVPYKNFHSLSFYKEIEVKCAKKDLLELSIDPKIIQLEQIHVR